MEAYNGVSAGCWMACFGLLVKDIVKYGTIGTMTYRAVLFSQFLNTLDIVFACLRVTRSPVLPTVMQAASRFASLHVMRECYAYNVKSAVMVLAWIIADTTRYMFYLYPSDLCKSLRYTLFIGLYPVGFMMEMLLLWDWYRNFKAYCAIVLLLIWPVGFYFMYTHMLRQRRRIFALDTNNDRKK